MSPISADTILVKGADGTKERVPKLLYASSLTALFIDFKKQHATVKLGERAFRNLMPRQLRKMDDRHKQMCVRLPLLRRDKAAPCDADRVAQAADELGRPDGLRAADGAERRGDRRRLLLPARRRLGRAAAPLLVRRVRRVRRRQALRRARAGGGDRRFGQADRLPILRLREQHEQLRQGEAPARAHPQGHADWRLPRHGLPAEAQGLHPPRPRHPRLRPLRTRSCARSLRAATSAASATTPSAPPSSSTTRSRATTEKTRRSASR